MIQDFHFSWRFQYPYRKPSNIVRRSFTEQSILTNYCDIPARGWLISCISPSLEHKSIPPYPSYLSTLFTDSGPMLKAIYKHMTFTIYSNLLILDMIVQITLSSHHSKHLRQYLVFESGPAETPMCELGLSGSHTSIPTP